MRRATREARTLAISAHAAAEAQFAVARLCKGNASLDARAARGEWYLRRDDADRYWLRLARTLKGRG